MTSIVELGKNVENERLQFEKTLQEARSRVTLPGLARHTFGLVDWHRTRHSLIVLGAIAGTAWLINTLTVPKSTAFIQRSKKTSRNKGD